MNGLLGLVVVVGALYGARRATAGTMSDPLAARLSFWVGFFAIFFVAFFVQGFIELAVHAPIVGLPLTTAIVVAEVVAIAFVRRGAPPVRVTTVPADDAGPIRQLPKLVAIITGASFVVLALLLLLALPRGYEVKAYHLPIAVRILRDGTLGIWDSAFMHAYPANMSIWAGFFLHLLPERWTTIANLPFVALLGAAVYGLCRSAGADRSAALLATAGLVTIPIFGFSAIEVAADLGGLAFVAVAAYLMLSRAGTPTARAGVAGIACGIAFGFKSLDLIPIAVLGLFVIVECAGERRRERSTIAAFAPVAWFTLSAIAMMGFWLVRNAIEAGNPLYPVHIGGLFDLLGWRAAPDFDLKTRITNEAEWVARSRDWLTYPWTESQAFDQNFKHSSGLGPFFAATIPVTIVLWPLRLAEAWRHRGGGPLATPVRAQAALYAIAVVVFVAWWVLCDRQPRYFMAAIVALVPIAATMITATRGRLRTGYEALLAIGIVTMTCVLLVRLAVENGPFLLNQRGASRWQTLQYPPMVDRLPADAVIVDGVDRAVDYALLGDRLANHVIDTAEAYHRFVDDGQGLRLTHDNVAASHATHFYALADLKVATDRCISLREIARLDRNPFNGQPFEVADVLYAIDDACRASAAR